MGIRNPRISFMGEPAVMSFVVLSAIIHTSLSSVTSF